MRALLGRDVSAAGHEVVAEARDVAAATVAARMLRPDAIILDGRLPGASAIEAVTRIFEAHPATAVLVLVSLAERELMGAVIAAGARGGLIRPLRAGDISDALARISKAVL